MDDTTAATHDPSHSIVLDSCDYLDLLEYQANAWADGVIHGDRWTAEVHQYFLSRVWAHEPDGPDAL